VTLTTRQRDGRGTETVVGVARPACGQVRKRPASVRGVSPVSAGDAHAVFSPPRLPRSRNRMQQRDPRLMTHREIVSELASILARGYLRHVKARRFMDEGGPLPSQISIRQLWRFIVNARPRRDDSAGILSLTGTLAAQFPVAPVVDQPRRISFTAHLHPNLAETLSV